MAIGWLALLKAVPWVDVARKAPEIAESAKRLWEAIGKKSSNSDTEIRAEPISFSSQDQEIAQLKHRLAAIEEDNIAMQNQILASAELIKALSDQNTQLIIAVDWNRKRLTWLTVISAFIIIYCAISIFSN